MAIRSRRRRPARAKQPKLLQFTVHGDGPFPLDMLRYDVAKAATPADQDKMITDTTDPACFVERYITLVGKRCTIERWKSYGWLVTEQKP